MLIYIKILIKFFFNNIYINKFDRAYINYNKHRWSSYKVGAKSEKVILVDLFHWNPFIHFWSYVTNILSKRLDAKVKYFYFDLYQGRLSKTSLFIHKLKKIFGSFNVSEGISEYNFQYTNEEIEKFEKLFNKFGRDKKKLLNYKKKELKIGDLIYDTYLRITYKPTLDLEDKRFKSIFFRAEKIYKESKNFFKKNKVVCVVPSHICYINFGIISRLALNKKIPVIKIRPENRGNSLFKLLKINPKYTVDEFPYYQYKKIFKKFSNKNKQKALLIGKKLLDVRISGKYDKNLPFMPISQFNRKLKISKNIGKNKKKKIVIFPHCYFDNPHRFRYMLFNDFYDQIKYFLNLSRKLNMYDWYYKPHPNELRGDLDVHKDLLKDFPNVKYLHKSTGHVDIINLNPKCIITNHGTIAHEYAAFKIPVINTGDNHHINYNFCIHANTKKMLNKIMNNLDYYGSKINFDKKEIYEFLYMHFEYFPNLNKENIFLKNSHFAERDIRKNNKSELFYKFSNQSKIVDKNIEKYVSNFVNFNIR